MSDQRKERTGMGHHGRVDRRQFLFQLGVGAGGALLASTALADTQLLRAVDVENPLSKYPNRDWERHYRDLYRSDTSFVFLCAPNDTHNCLLRAHVKSGVVTRISPSFAYHKATDLAGNRASRRWDPRCCQKGLALVRRFYGDRRVKRPMIRAGFKAWIEAGCPRDEGTGAVDKKWLDRGRDAWVAASWDEAFDFAAKALVDIAKAYTGEAGQARLLAQGYDPLMVEATQGAGTQVLKFRGGMAALGITRIMAFYRLANSMALLDDKLRGGGRERAVGARGWDNYAWHTDLPPGHPMVVGQQTNEFDLCNVEHAGLVIAWGLNWITTKMPDGHWLTEARLKGTKVVVIACEYSATSNKGDEVVVVRPGTTPALALGLAQVLIAEKLYDPDEVKTRTDLPFLVRLDTGDLLRAKDALPGHEHAPFTNNITVLPAGQKPPPAHLHAGPIITEAQREAWGDFVVWDEKTGAPAAVHRDAVGGRFAGTGLDPRLEGAVEVTLVDGTKVACRTVFDLTREVLDGSYTPDDVQKLTWCPADVVRSLARQVAANQERTIFALGMGPNQFFNSDLKDRAVFLVAALTRNVGRIGGNVGSYAGNYRSAMFSGVPQYVGEDPFAPELDPAKPAPVRTYFRTESAHYFNHGDTILRYGKGVLTGKTHMPTPTKSIMVSNSNSLIGNAKGHYETVVNGLPRVEFVAVSEWWWTGSCEYADIVFPVDSWAEFKVPDMTMSVTNPFLYVFPATPLPRIHDTRPDAEVVAGVGRAVGRLTGDPRHEPYWRFVAEGGMRPYLQRILDHSALMRGYKVEDLERKAEQGTPAMVLSRTYPKWSSWEQIHEDKPWYTRSGRMEFYRDEPEFKDSGENLVVHREPIDSTFFEPNVIVARPHPVLRPKTPEDYGADRADLSTDARQARHVVRSVDELMKTEHPLMKKGYDLIFHTPKYRHGAHTTPVDTDIVSVWFGPFGDMYRHDKRTPFVNELFVDINPADAKRLGVEDGDYVWIDADPKDRPYHGWKAGTEEYKLARLMARARYYPGTPVGITRMWHNAYGSTYGSVRGHESDPTGLAKCPETNYQALFRYGSHQSCTRGWLKPTWMTDTLHVKTMYGQEIVQGWVPDIHGPTGAPREAIVKITPAEQGGLGGEGLWRPAKLGLRPTYEAAALKKFIAGEFVRRA
ncbi:MAG: molybdopterin-dependent oxidoreductase [Planctomycetes bacterium]|nr:molybdopterin-dependent oxidoreductase [Planctomycetota bacterium]